MKNELCLICTKKLTGRQTKYCSQLCASKAINTKHNNKQSQHQRGLANKIKLIKHLGGECSSCGYDRNYASLAFHHIDESTKSFGLDIRKCSGTKFERLIEETNKCILLCHNCHHELHHPHMAKMVVLQGIEP